MDITVKVRSKAGDDPAAAVRRAIEELLPDYAGTTDVEEVFPGVRSGKLAGMVVVRPPRKLSKAAATALLRALRARHDVVYAEAAQPRKGRR